MGLSVIHSFPPIINSEAKILILGSMPGVVSLSQHQYYAHPQNMFWKIMFQMFHKPYSNAYEERIQLLTNHKLALWDVLQNCEREGSLDSNICNEVPNEFEVLFSHYPQIEYIIFNGQAAYKYFKKYVGLETGHKYKVMPSTSPANAGKTFATKLTEWRQILDLIQDL